MDVEVTPGARPRRRPGLTVPAQLRALPRASRPRQWSKNLLVLAAPGAAGVLGQPAVAVEVALAFVAFCLLSSSTYLLNDVRDRDEDQRHIHKRHRPVAAGELSPRLAVRAALVLAFSGLALATAVRPLLGGVAAAYLALTATYSLWLRNLPVVDIAAITAGFVLRAMAGGAAVDVGVSRWFAIVTTSGALFIVAGKRYAELRTIAGVAPIRVTLRHYSARHLHFVLALSAAVAVSAYCLWASRRPEHGAVPWYELTILPFLLWLARYARLLQGGAGQAPEDLVLGDRVLLVSSAVWLALFACGVYVSQ